MACWFGPFQPIHALVCERLRETSVGIRDADPRGGYVEHDLAAMETERRDRQIKQLQRQASHFNLALVPAEQAA